MDPTLTCTDDALPEDAAALSSLIASHREVITEQKLAIAQLEAEVASLRKMIFGPKSERRGPDPPPSSAHRGVVLGDGVGCGPSACLTTLSRVSSWGAVKRLFR